MRQTWLVRRALDGCTAHAWEFDAPHFIFGFNCSRGVASADNAQYLVLLRGDREQRRGTSGHPGHPHHHRRDDVGHPGVCFERVKLDDRRWAMVMIVYHPSSIVPSKGSFLRKSMQSPVSPALMAVVVAVIFITIFAWAWAVRRPMPSSPAPAEPHPITYVAIGASDVVGLGADDPQSQRWVNDL